MHTHILPGVDDGSDSFETSLALLKEEVASGVTDVVLTPHQNEKNLNKEKLQKDFEAFKAKVSDVPLNLCLGSEIYYYPDLKKDLKEDKILTMNHTVWILLEFSTRTETPVSDIVYDLSVLGYKVIIAHIERYGYLNESDYDEIHKYAKIQVNAKSFEGREYRKILKYLMKHDMIDFVASDCHNLDHRNVDFKKAKKTLSKKKDLYHRIFENEAPWK